MPSLVSNIGVGGRRQRYVIGGVCLLLAVIAGAALIGTGAARGFRFWLLLPLWGAALGIFQARGGTCVRLAALGRRDMDTGARPIDDPWLVAQLKRQARDIHLQSAFAAIGLTGLVLLIPG